MPGKCNCNHKTRHQATSLTSRGANQEGNNRVEDGYPGASSKRYFQKILVAMPLLKSSTIGLLIHDQTSLLWAKQNEELDGTVLDVLLYIHVYEMPCSL